LRPLDFVLCDIAAQQQTVLLPGLYSLPERESPTRESQQPVVKIESKSDVLDSVQETVFLFGVKSHSSANHGIG
jgi:hypothetical protein